MSKELITLEDYKICDMAPADLGVLLKENLGGGKLQLHQLDELKFPSARSTTWDIPDITQESGFRSEADLNAVILLWNDIRRYWEKEFGTGEASAPDCRSDDLEEGVGDPGGLCDDCDFSQWGSDIKGPGERCKQSRELLLLLPEKLLPMRLSIGPGSLKHIKSYFTQLITQGTPYWKAITSFTLKTEKSSGDVAFPKCSFRLAGTVGSEELKSVATYREAILSNVAQG